MAACAHTGKIQDDLPHFHREMTRACLLQNAAPLQPTSTVHTEKVNTVTQTQLSLSFSQPRAFQTKGR